MATETSSNNWQAQPGGQEIGLDCPLPEVLFEGDRAGGKSDLLLFSFFRYVGCGYGAAWQGVIFRRTYQGLGDLLTKAQKWLTQIWPEAKLTRSAPPKITWPTGEELLFTYAKDVSDYDKHHGWEKPFLGFDELTQWPDDKIFKRLHSINRSDRDDIPLIIRATSNPYGVGHNWVKNRYKLPVLGRKRGERIGETVIEVDEEGNQQPPRVAINVPREDNLIFMGSNPNYEAKLRAAAQNPAELAAHLYGEWDITAGGMFDDLWDAQVHVVPSPPATKFVQAGWDIRRALDWGESKPFSVQWWAHNTNGNSFEWDGHVFGRVRGDRYHFAEWYGCTGHENEGLRLLGKEVARGIIDREEDMRISRAVRIGPADHDTFYDRDGHTIAEDMAKEGVKWEAARKGNFSRKEGWRQMRTLLKGALPSETGAREDPGMFVTSSCENWRRTVPSLPRDDSDLDDVDTEAEDHCFAPGTLVQTDTGLRRIDDLVGVRGKTVGPDGRFYEFTNARRTRRDADLVRVRFHDGTEIECTPDHKFLTMSGEWTRADQMLGEWSWSVLPSRPFSEPDTTSAVTISSGRGVDSTKPYGSISTGPYPTGSTSITGTKTEVTISPAISTVCREEITYLYTQPQGQSTTFAPSKKPKLRHLPGTQALKAGNGTDFISSVTFSQSSKSGYPQSAKSAEVTTWSPRPSRSRGNTAPHAAGTLLIVGVEPAGKSDVYCMTVPEVGCFALANGAVVSNCGDCSRFYLRQKPQRMGIFKLRGR